MNSHDLSAVQTRLDAARAKAAAVETQQELSGVSKAREINKIYARAHSGGGAKKGKPSRSAKRKQESRGPRLDKRMHSDRREVSSSSWSDVLLHTQVWQDVSQGKPSAKRKQESRGPRLDKCMHSDRHEVSSSAGF